MKILFIGEGLADYTVNILNRLNRQPNIEVFNVVDRTGTGHVPASVRQTRDGVEFNIVELTGTVFNRYSDENFWSFSDLEKTLRELQPSIVSVSLKYLKAFTNDQRIVALIKELNIKLITNDNPRTVELYEERKECILAGKRDFDYTPWYVMYFLSLCEKFSIKDTRPMQRRVLNLLQSLGFLTLARRRAILLQKLEEMKTIFNMPCAHISYTERAYEVYESYGVPRENIFIKYNSPDTDILFAIREKVEHEPPILSPNPHRIIHIGRLAPYKRLDMLIASFKDVRKTFPDAELYILGQGSEEQPLKKLVAALTLEGAVHFTGWVDQRAMGRYLLASAVCVLSGNGGLSINDAMAFGRPIICSVADGTEKHLVFEGKNGMYFKSGDGRDLTEKISHLLAHPELLAAMGQYSTDVIKNKININTTIAAYRQAFAHAVHSSV